MTILNKGREEMSLESERRQRDKESLKLEKAES